MTMEDENVLDFVRNCLEGDVSPSARRRSLVVAAVTRGRHHLRVSWWRAGSALAASLALAVLGFWGREVTSREEPLKSVLVLLGSEVSAEDESGGGLDEALMAWQDAPYLELAASDSSLQK